MNEKTKEVKLCKGKQLFGELKHFTHTWRGAIEIEIEGTITPIEIRSTKDFEDTRLFRVVTAYPISMVLGVSLPTYEALREDLWCPALRDEIIGYLESIPPNYTYMDSSLVKSAIPYVIKKLRSEDRPRTLALPQGAKLVGELIADEKCFGKNLEIVGNVVFADGKKKLIEFYEFKNIFCRWQAFSDYTTSYERKNKHLWNNKLADLIISLITEIMDFTDFKEELEQGRKYIADESNRARFCNQLHDQLLKADEEKLRHPKTIEAFEMISSICGLYLDTDLLQ